MQAKERAPTAGQALMIGDSVWDVKAACAARVPTLAVLTGGFSEVELREAGAIEVVREIAQIRAELPSIAALAGRA